jgi:hypothetical protein
MDSMEIWRFQKKKKPDLLFLFLQYKIFVVFKLVVSLKWQTEVSFYLPLLRFKSDDRNGERSAVFPGATVPCFRAVPVAVTGGFTLAFTIC